MMTILDFAKLSLYVYKDPSVGKYFHNYIEGTITNLSSFKPPNQSDGMYEVIVDSMVQSLGSLHNDFYASFFVKIQKGKAIAGIVAIRGTVPSLIGNDDQDVKSWWRNFFDSNAQPILPDQYTVPALLFFDEVSRYSTKTLGLTIDKLFVTGHSLGGAVAALLPTDYGVLARAVTFNAPGIANIQGVRDLPDFVINFRAEHDFVSAIDSPVGTQLSFVVPEEDAAAARAFALAREHKANAWTRLDIIGDIIETDDFIKSALDQHSMANLLQVLESSRDPDGKSVSVDTYGSLEAFFAAPVQHYDSPLLPQNTMRS